METTFGETVAKWHEFYLLTGTAAATLTGLLFVAISLNADRVFAPDALGPRFQAVQAFTNFVYVLLIALVFLVPDQSPSGLGWPVTVMALVALWTVVRRWWPGRARYAGRRQEWWRLWWQLTAPVVCYGVLLGVGVSVLTGSTGWLPWLIPVNLVLLGVAAGSAWRLLVEQRPGPPAGPA